MEHCGKKAEIEKPKTPNPKPQRTELLTENWACRVRRQTATYLQQKPETQIEFGEKDKEKRPQQKWTLH